MSLSRRPDFADETSAPPAPHAGQVTIGRSAPDPALKKARGPGDEGEALWFTVRTIDRDTPRLVLPWSIFQHVVMCRRPLCGLQSWARVGVIPIRRIAQDILHWAQRKGYVTKILQANQDNPCFVDLEGVYPEPQGDQPSLSPATGDYRPIFTFQDFLRNPSLGQHYRAGEGPPRPGRTALPCIDDHPSHPMPLAADYAEADHVRGLNSGQQRALFENLTNSSNAVMGGLLADTIRRSAQIRDRSSGKGSTNAKVRATQQTANRDPKYIEDLATGMSHVAAFQRHRSRLRAVQYQVAQGTVALQPRATTNPTGRTLPPIMSLGRSHRLHLLSRLDRLERQGVRWTAEEVASCYTMEQFLDYLEDRQEVASCYTMEQRTARGPAPAYDIFYADELPVRDFYNRRRAASNLEKKYDTAHAHCDDIAVIKRILAVRCEQAAGLLLIYEQTPYLTI
eukprot:s4464_g11.t1